MQMGRGCMALMPREPGTVGTATCTLCLLESAVQRGMGRGREEEEEEEEEEEAAVVVVGLGAEPPVMGGRGSGAEASSASLKKGLEAARTLR